MVKYDYDAWGTHRVLSNTGATITDTQHIGHKNPFRYRGYYYDTETGLYYLKSRYYDPETCRFINMDGVEYADPTYLHGLNLYAYCNNNPIMYVDPNGHDWETFWAGIGMTLTAIGAIALSATTFGAGIPLAMSIVAGITLDTGVLTGINGIATIVESGTNYNFVRDGIFNSVLGLSDSAYNIYSQITQSVATIGSMVLGIYHTTGQYKAAKASQQYLGKGYNKAGKNRWISQDGLRQVRWDTTHHIYNGKPAPVHFNWYEYASPIKQGVRNKPIADIHIWLRLFSYYS